MEDGSAPQSLAFTVLGSGSRIVLDDWRALVAGYTGRDSAAVQAHIDELAAAGVPPPSTVPAFYPIASDLVTQDRVITVSGANTSGEVEPVLVRHDGRFFLAVGSDHTDRDRERIDIAGSKMSCPKPVSYTVVPLGPADASLDLAAVEAASSVDGASYQLGSLGGLLDPMEVLASYEAQSGVGGADTVMFGGTVPLLGGRFVPGEAWDLALRFPNGIRLDHHYRVVVRPDTDVETRR